MVHHGREPGLLADVVSSCALFLLHWALCFHLLPIASLLGKGQFWRLPLILIQTLSNDQRWADLREDTTSVSMVSMNVESVIDTVVVASSAGVDTMSISITACSATQKTFAIPELLEQILLYLDPIALLGVQRVCTSFKNAIASSTTIQQRIKPDIENIKA